METQRMGVPTTTKTATATPATTTPTATMMRVAAAKTKGGVQHPRRAQLAQLQGLGVDWLSWEQWKRIARAFNLDTGEGLRGRPAGTGNRQLQVLQGIVGGLEDAEIARALGITPKTLRGHIDELYRKMQVNRRDRAIAKAWRASLGE